MHFDVGTNFLHEEMQMEIMLLSIDLAVHTLFLMVMAIDCSGAVALAVHTLF